jgi:diguanylate cyclase (GGDEF)-like protein/PAS domain S-box-containing protein
VEGSALRATTGAPPELLVTWTPDLLTVHEADGTVRFANGAAARLLGLSPEELEGMHPLRLVHPDDQGRAIEDLLRVYGEPESVHTLRLRVRHRDGSWRSLETLVRNRLDDPGLLGIVMSTREVSAALPLPKPMRLPEQRRHELVERASQAIAVVDDAGLIQFANAAAYQLAGLSGPQQILGRPVTDVVDPADHELWSRQLELALTQHVVPPPQEYRVLHAGGTPVLVSATPMPTEWDGRPAALVLLQDVTQLRSVQEEYTRTAQRFQLLIESCAEGVVGLDTDGRLTLLNPAAAEILGLDPETALGRNAHQLYHHSHPDGTPYDEASCPCMASAREGVPATGTAEVFWRSDGTPVPVDFRATPLRTDEPEGAVMTFCDVSERVRAERRLTALASFQSAVLDSLPAQTAVVDGNGTIVGVNAAWTRFMTERGGSQHTCGVGANFFDVCRRVRGPEQAQARQAAAGLRTVLDGEAQEFDTDVTCRWGDADPLFFWLHLAALGSPNSGAILGYTDITRRKRLEVDAAHRATHDELTGLPNRALLLDRLEHLLTDRRAAPVALLFVDLDHFKLVNDGYGHEAGDLVLRELARRLAAAVRPSDTVARLSGDEFVILCEHLPYVTEAYRLAERVLTSLAEPFPVGDNQLTLGASIGIAVAEEPTVQPDELLRAADQAMFEAKARGRNQYAVFDAGIHQRSRKRLEQALTLRRMVDDNRFALHYQPVVELRDGHVTAAEALLRPYGDGDLLDAASTVALAEETGLIDQIGRWVLHRACADGATFRRADGSFLPLSVNLAPHQIHGGLIGLVTDASASTGFPLTALTLELTERTVMANPEAAVDVLDRLRGLGVRIAIDDFGVGYSSLASLRDLPLDSLKIDRGFVQALTGRPADQRLVQAIVDIAHALQLDVVAEGIEQSQQRDRLLELGCHIGQGFLFSPAQPAEAVRLLAA